MNNLESTASRIQEDFSLRDIAREKALRRCREIIRYSAAAIRAIHLHEDLKIHAALTTATENLNDLKTDMPDSCKDLLGSGFIHDAQKEYAEANIFYAFVNHKDIPSPEQLGIKYPAYLHGLAETVGELRRYLLDSIRKGDYSYSEEILDTMDGIYSLLLSFDFPDAITQGLRRSTDSVRGILEKTRSDLTLILKQKELEIIINRTMP